MIFVILLLFFIRLNYKGDFKTTPSLITGDGDGTVNIRSLKSCEQWAGTKAQNAKKINSVEYAGADHLGILADKRVIKYILELLTDDSTYDAEESEIYDSRFANLPLFGSNF